MTALSPHDVRKLDATAEPGPWHVEVHPAPEDQPDGWPLIVVRAANGREIVAVIEDDVAAASESPRENAEFIAAARTALPETLNENERLRLVVDAARQAVNTDGVDDWNELVDAVTRYDDAEAVARG